METFPVSNSTLSAAHVGLFVQDKYALSSVACRLLKAGVNHSYLITSGSDKYIFRIYSLGWRNRHEIQEEIRLLAMLKDNGMPVSYALTDAAKNHIQQLSAPEGLRYGVLFSYARGEKMLNFRAELHYNVGQVMGRMHNLTQGFALGRATYTPQVILIDSFEQLRQILPADTEEYRWMLSTQKYLFEELSNADTAQLRTGGVHMDIWFDNMNFTENGDITLFDFDFCGNGWLCYDIAYYILQLYSTEKVADVRDEKLQAFLDGYESITPISAEEKRLLPMLGVAMYYFYLGVQCQRFTDWSNVFVNETYLKRFIDVLVRKYFEERVLPASSNN
jgi:Ser/Thr protein kinase RdoA (MazF antagonist)